MRFGLQLASHLWIIAPARPKACATRRCLQWRGAANVNKSANLSKMIWN